MIFFHGTPCHFCSSFAFVSSRHSERPVLTMLVARALHTGSAYRKLVSIMGCLHVAKNSPFWFFFSKTLNNLTAIGQHVILQRSYLFGRNKKNGMENIVIKPPALVLQLRWIEFKSLFSCEFNNTRNSWCVHVHSVDCFLHVATCRNYCY